MAGMNKCAALPEGGRGEFLDKRHNGVTLHARELFVYLRLLFEAWCRCWFKEDATEYILSTDEAYVGGEVTTLSFKVAGLIETVAIVDNQSVKAGDLLLKLDDRDYRAQLARAEANIAARQAALVNVDATRRMRVACSTRPGLTWPQRWLSGCAPNMTSIATER
jgi:hypothetical protein